MSKAQELVLKIRDSQTSPSEIMAMFDHELPLVRINALMEISERVKDKSFKLSNDDIDKLIETAKQNDNQAPVGPGNLSVAHFAIACLFDAGTEKAYTQANQIISHMTSTERENILLFLRGIESAQGYLKQLGK